MGQSERTRAYVVAVLVVAIAFAIRWSMTPIIGRSVAPAQMFYLAVFVAAWTGGFWPGVLATALSIVVAYPGFIAPFDPLRPTSTTVLTSATFVGIGLVISWLSESRRQALERAREHATERLRKEEALRAADRQKDEFLGMLAHELRNPLAPIMYSVSLLERQMPSPDAKRPLEIISRQVRRMTRLVDDLLDVSRVTQGKISLQRERIDLGAIVRHAADATRAVMEQRGHQVNISLPPQPVYVMGDAARLGQVFENLLSNAAKYTPSGGRVRITLQRDGKAAAVSVADNGIGIPPDALPRVFDLFMQADTSLDRAEGGLGIGLTLVERLARLHGGSVDVRSDGPGQGSEFIVRLPLAAEEHPQVAAGASSGATASATRRFLVVDDNMDSTEALRLLLEMRGHTVRVVHDGHDAIGAALEFRPEVVLLDVGLPGLDGFEIVKRLRKTPETSGLLVIATTGYGREEDRARCLAAGFNHHLAKPVDIGRIEELVGTSS